MDIQAEKTLLIKQLQQIDDIDLIRSLKSLMEDAIRKDDKVYTLNDYNKEIDLAENEIDNGQVISHTDLMNSVEK